MRDRTLKRFAVAALVVVLGVAVAVLAGVSAANPGHGNGNGNGNGNGKPAAPAATPSAKGKPTTPAAKGKSTSKPTSSSAAQYQYSAGKQYGRHKVLVCHKGHTIRVAQPALKGHLRHGDHAGAC